MDGSPITSTWCAVALAQIHRRDDEAEGKPWYCGCRSCIWARQRMAAPQPKRQRTAEERLAERQEELKRSHREVSDEELDRRALAMNASEGR